MADSRLGLAGLAALGGGGAIVLIGLVVVGLRALSPAEAPAAKASGSAQGSGAQATKEGMHARGTDELRAIGCATALVMDMQHVLGDAAVREGDPRFIVSCDVPAGAAAPTCERAAGTYFAALGNAGVADVNIRVSHPASLRPICSRLYAPSGADLGEYPRGN